MKTKIVKQISLKLDIDQLKNFQRWKQANGDDFSLWDYLSRASRAEVAIAFTKLFWPDFIEHEGGVFLSEAFNVELYQQWKAHLGNDLVAIERVINHQHLDDILSGADKVGIKNLFYLGEVLVQMWESRLKSLYPDKDFEVICNQDENTVVVTFNQIR